MLLKLSSLTANYLKLKLKSKTETVLKLIEKMPSLTDDRSRMAKILSGKDAAADLRTRLQVEVASYGKSFKPGLTILQVRKKS